MYESPITMYLDKVYHQMDLEFVDGVCRAVLNCNIEVDKAELLRALAYDRGQYEKGHSDGFRIGYESRDNEIVRCKDCKHWRKKDFQGGCDIDHMEFGGFCPNSRFARYESEFCSCGERRDSDG